MSAPPTTGSRRPLLSTGAAARVAGCHSVTIPRAIHSGELEAIRLGRRADHRVHVDALNRWLHPTRKGNRPSFVEAARPEQAEPLVGRFVDALRAERVKVETGRFGAMMEVELVNDGPVTIVLDVPA